MSAIFADAFYFVGLINRADQHHAKAVAAAKILRGEMLTTEWVLAEFADAMAKSSSRSLVQQFISDLKKDPRVKITAASSDLFARGLQLYDKRADKQWSLTDCISFTVMAEEKLTEALTGDKHFEQAGFKALLR